MTIGQQILFIVLVAVFGCFMATVIHGIFDHIKGRAPFWKRPIILLGSWALGTYGAFVILGGCWAAQYFKMQGDVIFGVVLLMLGLFHGGMCLIGGVRYSFVTPWIDAHELP